MSDGDRGKRDQNLGAIFGAIALFGCVILAGAIGNTLGVDSGRDQVSAREHYQNAKANELRACSGREGRAAIQCATEAIEAAQEQSDSRQDLYAQRDMSRWAFWLLIATVITLGVTALGVFFVKRTLDATLEAVEDTSEATEAMKASNDIARRTAAASEKALQDSRAQLRAYITVEYVNLEDFELGKQPIFYVTFKNTGQTPAFSLRTGSALQDMELPFHESKLIPMYVRLQQQMAGAGSTFSFREPLPFFVGEADLAVLSEGKIALIAQAEVNYLDIFGEEHVTKIRLMFGGEAGLDPKGTMIIMQSGNDFN